MKLMKPIAIEIDRLEYKFMDICNKRCIYNPCRSIFLTRVWSNILIIQGSLTERIEKNGRINTRAERED